MASLGKNGEPLAQFITERQQADENGLWTFITTYSYHANGKVLVKRTSIYDSDKEPQKITTGWKVMKRQTNKTIQERIQIMRDAGYKELTVNR